MYIQNRLLVVALVAAMTVIPGCGAAGLLLPFIEDAIDKIFEDDQAGDLVPDDTAIGEAVDLEILLGGRTNCDPANGLDQRATIVSIRHTGDPGSDPIEWEFIPETDTKLYTPTTSGTLARGESINLEIFAHDCDFFLQDFRMRTYFTGDLGVPGRSTTTTVTVRNVTNVLEPTTESFSKLLSGVPVQSTLSPTFNMVEFGESVKHGDIDVPDKVPNIALSQISYYGSLEVNLDASELLTLFTGGSPVFPLGSSSNGDVYQADVPATMPSGNYRLVYFAVDGEFDLMDTSRRWRFAVAFDSDGDSGNDYTPPAQTANDPLQGTDRWYFLDFAPGDGWSLRRIDSDQTETSSAARVIQSGNSLVWVIPKTEVPGPNASYRVVAFTHTGDGGITQPHDWSGDHHPIPSETAALPN
ncbi:MAG: hypothetical protein ACYTGZ_17130 [Planctomycetota bacterium]|jgi:hypothetical protein